MSKALFSLFNNIYPLPESFWNELSGNISERSFKRKTKLLLEGDICTEIHFIVQGMARAWYYKGEEEITSWFMKEDDIIISVESFFSQKQSMENIELLEDSTLISLPFNTLQVLYSKYLEFNFVGRVLTERYYMLSEERLYGLRMRTGDERYNILSCSHPEIFQRVPLKYIASYLGMRPETISRIRAQQTSISLKVPRQKK